MVSFRDVQNSVREHEEGIENIVGQFTDYRQQLASSNSDWRNAHLDYHRELATELDGRNARVDERLKSVDAMVVRMDTMEYRLQQQESGVDRLEQQIERVQSALNTVAGDIRVMREILTRLDPAAPRSSGILEAGR